MLLLLLLLLFIGLDLRASTGRQSRIAIGAFITVRRYWTPSVRLIRAGRAVGGGYCCRGGVALARVHCTTSARGGDSFPVRFSDTNRGRQFEAEVFFINIFTLLRWRGPTDWMVASLKLKLCMRS